MSNCNKCGRYLTEGSVCQPFQCLETVDISKLREEGRRKYLTSIQMIEPANVDRIYRNYSMRSDSDAHIICLFATEIKKLRGELKEIKSND